MDWIAGLNVQDSKSAKEQKRAKHFVMTMKEKMRIRCVLQYTKVYFKHTVFLSFFDREWVRDGW